MGDKVRATKFQQMLDERKIRVRATYWDSVLIEVGLAQRIDDWTGKYIAFDTDALDVLEGYFSTVEKYRGLGLVPHRNSYRANGFDFVAYARGADTAQRILTEWPELWKGPIGKDRRAVYGVASASGLLNYLLGGRAGVASMHRIWLQVFTDSGYAKQIKYGKQTVWRFDVDAILAMPKYLALIAELQKEQEGGVLYGEEYEPNGEDFTEFRNGANTMRLAFEGWPGVRKAMGLPPQQPYTNLVQSVKSEEIA